MTHDAAGLFPITDAERHAKGRQKMLGLALYITHVWEATTSTGTSFWRDRGLEMHSERVAVELAPALAAIRTLDLEVIRNSLHGADAQRYLALQDSDAQGQVVRGLVLLRNADIHLPSALKVDVNQAVGEGDVWRIMPSWSAYANLPMPVRSSPHNRPSVCAAYENAVGGHPVLETLLDAFAFFDRCDSTLARRDVATGELMYFPLRGPTLNGYERRHPDELNRSEVEADVRQRAEANPPIGDRREIEFRINREGATVYCGHTAHPQFRTVFTEKGAQIARDVQAGYPYIVVVEDGTHRPLALNADGHLVAGGRALKDIGLPCSLRHPCAETWVMEWGVVTLDAFYYREQRHGGWQVHVL
ncbi:hypothetical protein ACIQVR_38545 [Streptomyces xanthochromogenes]|uniref:hypothetical protein n=1 Tax=Streptomyces xanthochromogenes TaxID=67384 RepID=UPI003822287B